MKHVFLILAPVALVASTAFAQAGSTLPPPPLPPGQNSSAPPLPGTQEVPFMYDKPSDEMDFAIKPVPQAHFDQNMENTAPPIPAPPASPNPNAPAGDAQSKPAEKFDQFFSTTTVLPTVPDSDVEAKPDANDEPAPIQKSKKGAKKIRKLVPQAPAFQYRSVRLPKPVYDRSYIKGNEHLPLAIWEADLPTLLAAAIERGDNEAIRALAKNGASLQSVAPSGDSMVTLAIKHNRINTVRWLLQHGADPNQPDSEGASPWRLAAGDQRILNLLQQYGANQQQASTATPVNGGS